MKEKRKGGKQHKAQKGENEQEKTRATEGKLKVEPRRWG